MYTLAFFLGVLALGIVNADVSHLRQNPPPHIPGHFVANNGQLVRQSFNSNGDASFSSQTYSAGNDPNPKTRYWWMNTENMPHAQQHNNIEQNYFSAAGCNGCASRTLNIKHNTQHDKHQNAYSQNSFQNVNRGQSRYITQPTSVSGPQEVNNFFGGRNQQSSQCADSNSACVAARSCYNGFIDQSAENKAVRSSVSVFKVFIVRLNASRHQPTSLTFE